MRTVHIVGAGLAGLAAAVRLTGSGRRIVLHEASGHAGGRCRSFHDDTLGCTIDNGNHLLLSGNTAVNDYLAIVDATDELTGPDTAEFPFVEMPGGLKWTIRFGPGRLPFWIFDPARRIPETRLHDYVGALRIIAASADDSLADLVTPRSRMFRRFWEPLAVAILNTPADAASARLLGAVLRETFARGAHACLPRIARHGLSETFVTPALKFLEQNNAEFRTHRRLRRIVTADERISALEFTDVAETLNNGDGLILAVPSPAAAGLLSDLELPTTCHAIVNVHFRLDRPAIPENATPILGLVDGTAHWLFFRGDIVSATISAADELVVDRADRIAELVWNDIVRAVEGVPDEMPRRYRVIKEKRATFSQTPESVRLRPPSRTRIENLFLAGDWTDTGIPATIEGAIRSGFAASAAILGNVR